MFFPTELEKSTKKMLTLLNLEDGGDTFAQRAEMYYQNIPELVKNVEDYRRWYYLLAEHCSNLSIRTLMHSRSLDIMSLTTTDNNKSSDSSNNSNQLSTTELSGNVEFMMTESARKNEGKSEAKREIVAEVERLMEENNGLKDQLREIMFENAALTQAKHESDKESGGETVAMLMNKSDAAAKISGKMKFWRLKSRKFRSFSC